MKRIAAILACLLIAAAPSLSMAASLTKVEAVPECGGCCDCGASACCAEGSDSAPVDQPAVPAGSSSQQLSASLLHAASAPIVLPLLPAPIYAAADDLSSLSSKTPLYLRNCARLI
jgi:hypothetical protein